MKTYLCTSVAALLLAGSTATSLASDSTTPPDSPPPATLDGTVTLSGAMVGAGIGYKWGHGTLSFQGQLFDFCIHGLSMGDVGAARLTAQGAVYNLKSLGDFSGKYLALSGGFALAKGESAAIMRNKKSGVMMELEVQEVGLRFNIAATGVKIILGGEHGCNIPQATHD